jgi:hypothetical protein
LVVLLLADVGEWVNSNILFGLVFLISALGVVGIGWWVIRGDRLNRAVLESQVAEQAAPDATAAGDGPATPEPEPAKRRRTRRRQE